MLSFHSDSSVQKRGFELFFTRFPMGKYSYKKSYFPPKLEGSIITA